MPETVPVYVITYVVAGVIGGFVLASKLGWVHIGKLPRVCTSMVCSKHEVILQQNEARMTSLTKEQDYIKSAIVEQEKRMTQEITEVREAITELDEKLDHHFNEMYSMLRTYSATLYDHIGYCRGAQEAKHAKQHAESTSPSSVLFGHLPPGTGKKK